MGRRQLTVWAESISCCLWASFLSEINVRAPSYMCAQTQLHAMRGYCGSALMCSSVIIRTLLCPIRRGDRQWKHSIDYLHFIIKPITTWKGGGKKEWNKDENELQEDKDSLFSCLSPHLLFLAFLGLVTECDQSLQTHVWREAVALIWCVCVCVWGACMHVDEWKWSSCQASNIIFLKLLMFNFSGSRGRGVFIIPVLFFWGWKL